MTVSHKPEGYHTITPYLLVSDADNVIKFAKEVFAAELKEQITHPETGTTMHAELQIGDSRVMVGNKKDSPGASGMLYIYVEDTDATYAKAIAAGAISIMEPADQFYGDRNAGILDPEKNKWWIATHIEDLSSEQINQRAAEFYRK